MARTSSAEGTLAPYASLRLRYFRYVVSRSDAGLWAVALRRALPPLLYHSATISLSVKCVLGTTVQTCVLGPCVKPRSFEVYTTALGIATEREANQRTQVFPVELINLLLRYGSLQVRATRF